MRLSAIFSNYRQMGREASFANRAISLSCSSIYAGKGLVGVYDSRIAP
jgi:hypothetical protein